MIYYSMIELRKIPRKHYDKNEQFGSIFAFKVGSFEFDINNYKEGFSFDLSYDNLYSLEYVTKEGQERRDKDYEKDSSLGKDWYAVLFSVDI